MQMCPGCGVDNRDMAQFCSNCGTALVRLLGSQTVLHHRYRIVRLLGCGGMGAVYEAEDLTSGGRRVAVKENLNMAPDAQAQFQLEASTLAALKHPNLPAVSAFFVGPTQRQYAVMDYIAGEDLEAQLAAGPQPEAQALHWFNQICGVVTFLHHQSPPVIHRDIKPSNIRLTPQGQAYLVDFGLMKRLDPARKTTRFLKGMGSACYTPLEQYGSGVTDARSDVYALAATLYHALTGQPPPEANQRLANPALFKSARALNPNLSTRLDAALTKALAIDASGRFPSIDAFARAIAGGSSPWRLAAYASLGLALGAAAGFLPFLVVPSGSGPGADALRWFLIGGMVIFASVGGLLGLIIARGT